MPLLLLLLLQGGGFRQAMRPLFGQQMHKPVRITVFDVLAERHTGEALTAAVLDVAAAIRVLPQEGLACPPPRARADTGRADPAAGQSRTDLM
ncbi:hypothetical protein J7I98_38165 [Streptomyces sp. ISL-98]|uniref:hypothetical protein n=1 Tax=Streptomyces sp. ISL-98 TaxID=2819192 RepID=UPI001BEBE134|nr:hypothetical protein [Streptomyces sp. ISL-98]MBT2511521.1 hypothetical protein [Streptomyces sp. ISL-98]